MYCLPPFRLSALLAALTVLASCRPSETPTVPPQDPRWPAYVSYHTSGAISRRDKIRVLFAQDVVADSLVGQSASDFLRTSPRIDGAVTFASTHEIVLVPANDLPAGRGYRVRLTRGSLTGIPEDLREYEFVVQVMRQEFEVLVANLAPSPTDDSSMVLIGSVVTADVEDADRIEQILTATFVERDLPVVWRHESDGRQHPFEVIAIRRQATTQPLRLAWDGDAIGVDLTDEVAVEVPALDLFTVTSLEAVQDERQYVVVHFSDSLDAAQNLRGLVRLSTSGHTLSLEGSALRILPQQPLAGEVTVSLEPGIRSAGGKRLAERLERVVTFASNKPRVRFAGRGVILPENDVLSVPFEAVNVHSVQVTALRIYPTNIGQFLQVNTLGGGREVDRVGRYLWRRTIPLSRLAVNEWNRYSLDLTDLVREHPGGMFRISLSINRGNSAYTCSEDDNAVPVPTEPPLASRESADEWMASSWDYAEEYYGVNLDWRDREDPCKDAYYHWQEEVRDARNFLASNIGMLAKRDQAGEILVTTTDLRTAQPLSGVAVTFMNYQHQTLGSVTTGSAGTARLALEDVLNYAVARRGDDTGYLKMSPGTALPTSHFDVGGVAVTGGIKGHTYGERGVWRPGDDIHLTFVLEDPDERIPDNHPVSMQLFNPSGQRVRSVTNAAPLNGFYAFTLATEEDAPTGNWLAVAEVGGSRFTKTVKVETVIPNRLRVELDLGGRDTLMGSQPIRGGIFGQWLSGAIAGGLRADVQMTLRPVPTRFSRFADFSFDDPAREFRGEPQVLFDGTLDAGGRTTFETRVAPAGNAPGMLSAQFATRVFERGGAFSTNQRSATFSPYARYLGVQLPRGDAARGMLLTDTVHTVQIASLAADGTPVSVTGVQVTMYKVEWKWWWDRTGESLARYATSEHRDVVERGVVNTVNGRGTWQFEIEYPAWGRYLLRVCDPGGGHCAGRTFYIDWPGWAGRAREETGAGATMLTFSADKPEYTVGETARIQLPEATEGRALVTIETGSRVLEERWVELGPTRTRFDVPVTAAMSPNAYVSVTLIQPHAGRANDRPIRLYGIIPLMVTDPATRIEPVITAADEWRPNSEVTAEVSETRGRPMTYTLAVVDEGLLGLTSFQTPDLHAEFYRKEALGISTWDLFDDVVGAYGGELERLLALGGSGEAEGPVVDEEERRFPPVVRFLGPFALSARGRNSHRIDLPNYIGAVRVMVVAGLDGAYGSASKSVFVREPLSLLATLPRVIGPEEEMTVPIAVFAMNEAIRQATVRIQTDGQFTVVGSETATVRFDGTGERLAYFRVRAGARLGRGRVRFQATSGEFRSETETVLEVRSPNPMTTRQLRAEIAPGTTWQPEVVPHGLPGTNAVVLELSTLPPLNLDRRLSYLIRYPHGCVEQVTSSVFPQLYLPALIRLEPGVREEVERNVQVGIDRLRGYQVGTGAFAYWPGGFWGALLPDRDAWVTSYVGHFLVEADAAGYSVPPEMLSDWVNFQRQQAQSWTRGDEASAMVQAYRLYTLALAERPELSAMNRLRESGTLSTAARWHLAAAYRLAGLPQVAGELADRAELRVAEYPHAGWSLGSRLRDLGIVLTALVTLDRRGDADGIARQVSEALYADTWYSTHAVAYALMAMSKYYGVGGRPEGFSFEWRQGSAASSRVTVAEPAYSNRLAGFPDAGQSLAVTNTSDRPLYGNVVVRGIPASGAEEASSASLRVIVKYATADGTPEDVSELRQGTDFVAHVTVTNGTRMNLENLALEHMVPAGWEIHNPRVGADEPGGQAAVDYQDIRDDRIFTYFPLRAGQSKTFTTLFNAAYLGSYYLPSVSVEAMYDAGMHARTAGQRVRVVPRP